MSAVFLLPEEWMKGHADSFPQMILVLEDVVANHVLSQSHVGSKKRIETTESFE